MKTSLIIIGLILACYTSILTADVKLQSNGSTWPTIQDAVDNALSVDHLQVSTGLYVENVSISNKQLFIEGGFLPSFMDITNEPSLTVVSGSNGFFQSTFLVAWDSVVTFHNLEIIRGAAWLGGGISVGDNSAVTSVVCHIIENLALAGGGCFAGSNATLVLQNTVVGNNQALAGGGIYGSPYSKVLVEGFDSVFFGNYAESGAAIAGNKSDVTFRDGAAIHFNIAAEKGGGIALENNSHCAIEGPAQTYIGLSVAKPTVTNGNGGGIYAENSSIEISGNNCYIGSALASQNGGGVYLTNSSLMLLNGARLGDFNPGSALCASNNGGAVYMIDSTLFVSNNAEIYRGFAEQNGGGIYAERSTIGFYENSKLGNEFPPFGNQANVGGGLAALFCKTRFEYSSIVGNFADVGGGLVLTGSGDYHFTGCTIAENIASNSGGAIVAQGVSGGLIIEFTDVLSNRAGNLCGGAMIISYDDVLIQNSRFMWNEAGEDIGALYLVYYGTTTLQNTEVSFNKSDVDIGAIAASGPGNGMLNFIDCIIAQNTANSVSGMAGAVFLSGGSTVFKSETLGSLIINNSAAVGGAIYAVNNADIQFCNPDSAIDCLIAGNSASKEGGAIYMENWVTSELSGSINFINNHAFDGGAVFLISNSFMSLFSTNGFSPVVAENIAGNLGGGVAVFGYSSFKAANSIFDYNVSSNDGGAIYATDSEIEISADDFSDAQLFGLPPCRFKNNYAHSSGGALECFSTRLQIYDALMVSNSAYFGGCLSVSYSTVDVVNTVIAHNLTGSDLVGNVNVCNYSVFRAAYCTIAGNSNIGVTSECVAKESSVFLTNCIIWGNTGKQITTSAFVHVAYSNVEDGYPTGVGNIDADPLFDNPAEYNFALMDSSPCIDTGIVAGIGYDCLGDIRPYGGGVDIGAYEFIPEPGFYLLFIIYNLLIINWKRKFKT